MLYILNKKIVKMLHTMIEMRIFKIIKKYFSDRYACVSA